LATILLRHVHDVFFALVSRLALATLHFLPAYQSSRGDAVCARDERHCEKLRSSAARW